MGNQVTLTFAGDTDKLERSFDRVGSAASSMNRTVGASADGFDKVGTAADDVDTKAMGFRDTMTGVQDTMAGTAALAKGNLFEGFLLLGFGIGDLGSGMYNFLVPAIKSTTTSLKGKAAALRGSAAAAATDTAATNAGATAKNAFGGAVTRAKVALAGMSATARTATLALGAIGAVLLVAGAAYMAFSGQQKKAQETGRDLAETFDRTTGAATEATRALVLNKLEEEGAAKAAQDLGIGMNVLIDAYLGNKDALRSVNDTLRQYNVQGDEGFQVTRTQDLAYQKLTGTLNVGKDAMQAARDKTKRHAEAMVEAKTSAQKESEALQGVIDKLATLGEINLSEAAATRDYEAAVDAATEGLKENGRTLDVSTAKGRDNEANLHAIATAANRQWAATTKVTGGTYAANTAMESARAKFVAVAISMGKSAAQAQALATKLGLIPRHVDVKVVTSYTSRVFGAVGAGTSGGPRQSGVQRNAHGGVLSWVGESGAELIEAPAGTRVFSHEESLRIAGAGGGDRVVLELRSGGAQLDDLLVEVLSRAVKVRGGDVQLVLGNG